MKIAIVALCHPNRGKQLLARNRSIKKYAKSRFQYDNIVFEDKSIPAPLKERICKNTLDTKFVNIWDQPTLKLKASHEMGSIIGYKGMCLFYAMEIFHYLKDYDYYIRLDADSVLHSELNIDEFIDGNYIYGYVRKKHLRPSNLPQAINKYLDDKWHHGQLPVKILCGRKNINCNNFYNNFHITKLDFWRQPEVVDFLDYIYNEGGIKKFRWGDSPIQANAVRMFCPKEKIIKLNFKYYHGSHNWKNF